MPDESDNVTAEEMQTKREIGARFMYLKDEHLRRIILEDRLKKKICDGNEYSLIKTLEDLETRLNRLEDDLYFQKSKIMAHMENAKTQLAILNPEKWQRGDNTPAILKIDYSVLPLFPNLIENCVDNCRSISYIDVSKIELVLTLNPWESSIRGDENLKRLRALSSNKNKILLCARVAKELIKNPSVIPENWKKIKIYFWGSAIMNGEELCVPYIHYSRRGWNKVYLESLTSKWWPHELAACLPCSALET